MSEPVRRDPSRRRFRLADACFGAAVVAAVTLAASAFALEACTGEDPETLDSGLDATDEGVTIAETGAPADSGDAGSDVTVVKPFDCTLEFKDNIVLAGADGGSGLFDLKSLQVVSAGPDLARVIVRHEAPSYAVDIYEQDFNNTIPPPATKNLLTQQFAFVLDVQPMTASGGGYAILATDDLGLAIYELPDSAGLGDGGAIGTRLAVAGNAPYGGGRLTEIAPHDYFYVISRGSSAPYDIACGRTGGAIGTSLGPNAFVGPLTTEPGRDGNLLLHAFPSGTFFILNGPFGGDPVAYNIPDGCINLDAGVPTTTMKLADSDAGEILIGGKRTSANLFDLFFLKLSASDVSFWEGRASPADLAGGKDLSLGPPAFAASPALNAADSPFGAQSGGAIVGDALALAGTGIGGTGMNFAMVSIDGQLVAKETGTKAFFAGENRPFGAIAIAPSTVVGGSLITLFLAWIETNNEAGAQHTLYANRIRCVPSP